MKIQTQLKLVTGAVIAATAISTANAAQETVNASVQVNNTITMTVNSALDFGVIAAFANSNTTPDLATLVISADPAVAAVDDQAGTARIIALSPGTPADVSVAGAAANYALNVAVTAASSALSDPAGIAADGFTMGGFTTYAYLEGNNQTFGTTTDATGALGLNIGATLSTVTPAGGAAADASVAYTDATYTGIFEVDINY